MKCILSIIFLFFMLVPVCGKNYDFSDEATERFLKNSKTITIPSGATIESRLNSDIHSSKSQVNDIITTQLVKDWTLGSKVIAPEGSLIVGRITNKKKTTIVMGDAKLYIDFNKVIRPDGIEIGIDSKPIIITGDSRKQGIGLILLSGLNVILSGGTNLPADIAFVGYTSASGQEVKIPLGTEFKIHIINEVTTFYYDN